MMTPQEMRDYAAHMVQLAMHAGHSLGDVAAAAPEEHRPAVRQMLESARSFYRSAQYFAQNLE